MTPSNVRSHLAAWLCVAALLASSVMLLLDIKAAHGVCGDGSCSTTTTSTTVPETTSTTEQVTTTSQPPPIVIVVTPPAMPVPSEPDFAG